MDTVRNLLGHLDGGDNTCADIRSIAVEHLAQVRNKLTELQKLERGLEDMIATCDGGELTDCPILEALYT